MEGQAIHIDAFIVNVSTLVHSSNDLQRGKGQGAKERAKAGSVEWNLKLGLARCALAQVSECAVA